MDLNDILMGENFKQTEIGKVNKRAQSNIEGIIGSIFAIVFLILFVSAMIPVFNSLNGNNEKQQEIDKLNSQIGVLNQELSNKDSQIVGLQATIDSFNGTLNEKDKLISNLSSQILEDNITIQNLSYELSYLKDRAYLQEINNNYYNISNYFEKIEKKFFPIEISISLISVTILGLIIKEFALIAWFKSLYSRVRDKRNKKVNETTNKIQTN